ncbi:hypothetical protein ACN47E_004246 [Coniothyrium glycines]
MENAICCLGHLKENGIKSNPSTDPNENCSICLEPYIPEHDPVSVSSVCQHRFGSSCLEQYLSGPTRLSNRCPLCRRLWFQARGHSRWSGSFDASWWGNDDEMFLGPIPFLRDEEIPRSYEADVSGDESVSPPARSGSTVSAETEPQVAGTEVTDEEAAESGDPVVVDNSLESRNVLLDDIIAARSSLMRISDEAGAVMDRIDGLIQQLQGLNIRVTDISVERLPRP